MTKVNNNMIFYIHITYIIHKREIIYVMYCTPHILTFVLCKLEKITLVPWNQGCNLQIKPLWLCSHHLLSSYSYGSPHQLPHPDCRQSQTQNSTKHGVKQFVLHLVFTHKLNLYHVQVYWIYWLNYYSTSYILEQALFFPLLWIWGMALSSSIFLCKRRGLCLSCNHIWY